MCLKKKEEIFIKGLHNEKRVWQKSTVGIEHTIVGYFTHIFKSQGIFFTALVKVTYSVVPNVSQ